MKLIRRSLSTLIALSSALCTLGAVAGPLYRIESAQTIKSPSSQAHRAVHEILHLRE